MIESKMRKRSTSIAKVTIGAALFFGGTSLLLFIVFLLRGPFRLIILDVSKPIALGIDAILCLLFFVQHSGMVRKSFQAWIGRFVPAYLHRAIYAIASGAMLLALLIFWQPTVPILASAEGFLRWFLRGLFFVGILGFVWGARALGSFDAFGIQPIRAFLHEKNLRDTPMTIRGPYKWVRHPLYTFMLLIMWSCPDYSADRLLFNTTWTIWVFMGTVLEERDLASAFGESYRDYQKNVPMLIPWRFPKQPMNRT
jgi:protein-S-isoprenylcysteine O-methyltransferase Ste14